MFPETGLISGTVSDTGFVQSITMQQMQFISIFNEGLMICSDIITNSQWKKSYSLDQNAAKQWHNIHWPMKSKTTLIIKSNLFIHNSTYSLNITYSDSALCMSHDSSPWSRECRKIHDTNKFTSGNHSSILSEIQFSYGKQKRCGRGIPLHDIMKQ